MGKKEFEEFLADKKMPTKAFWGALKKEWLKYLTDLYTIFEETLKPYKGKVEINYDEVELIEEEIGKYKAPRMNIKIGDQKLVLQPIGTLLIATKGRVDILGGKGGTVKMVLVDSRKKSLMDHINVSVNFGGKPQQKEQVVDKDYKIKWEWKFVSTPMPGKYFTVTPDTIYQVITTLSNG